MQTCFTTAAAPQRSSLCSVNWNSAVVQSANYSTCTGQLCCTVHNMHPQLCTVHSASFSYAVCTPRTLRHELCKIQVLRPAKLPKDFLRPFQVHKQSPSQFANTLRFRQDLHGLVTFKLLKWSAASFLESVRQLSRWWMQLAVGNVKCAKAQVHRPAQLGRTFGHSDISKSIHDVQFKRTNLFGRKEGGMVDCKTWHHGASCGMAPLPGVRPAPPSLPPLGQPLVPRSDTAPST